MTSNGYIEKEPLGPASFYIDAREHRPWRFSRLLLALLFGGGASPACAGDDRRRCRAVEVIWDGHSRENMTRPRRITEARLA